MCTTIKFNIMKILHSYWSKPYFNKESDKGGWYHKKFHYMSCALSCLTFSKYYEVELVTDKAGKELFIDKLRLPYALVKVVLDDLNDYPSYLWAIGKLYSYSIQNEPFIHVDNDIYVWGKLNTDIINAQLIAHNLEVAYPHNKEFFNDIMRNFSYVPQVLIDTFNLNNDVVEINAGVFGGHDIDFIKKYTDVGFKFVDRNLANIQKLERPGMFNIIYEQFLFYSMALKEKKHIKYLLDRPIDENFLGVTDFWETPQKTKYIHTVGMYKTWYMIGEQMAQRLWFEYPEYYNRIIDLYNNGQL